MIERQESTREARSARNEREHVKDLLRLAEISLRKLSRESGLCETTLCCALWRTNYVRGERIIAKALGMKPEKLWPSRYQAGRRRSTGNRKGARR
jgi:Ner family transcriptional regulator